MAQATYEVHLAVYDLSHGMARALSGQFLGPNHAIDIIPHTGIVVYGKEYYYGGGVQSTPPHVFRQSTGMVPISTQLLGKTSVKESEFNEWCRQVMNNGRYNAASYDLLERNCNNFSHDAATEGLRLTTGVPEWILQVPQKFLASPMGQMVRPMLEQMQVTGNGSAAPFANSAPSVATAPPVAPTPTDNPWAHLGSSEKTSPPSTPFIDSHTKPLLSNDTKMASVCAKKLIATATEDSDKVILEEVGDALSKNGKPSLELIQSASRAILRQLNAKTCSVTFALMLFRLLVLYAPIKESVQDVCTWIQKELAENKEMPAPARSMAWCCLSNAKGTHDDCITGSSLEILTETAMGDLAITSPTPIRQAAAAFLYNVVLAEKSGDGELSDVQVSILCGSLDSVAEETDATTLERRLLAAAHLVKHESAAKTLVVDLGYIDALHQVKNANGDVEKVTSESIRLLES